MRVLKNLKTIHECVNVKPVKYLSHVLDSEINLHVSQSDVHGLHELLPLQVQKLPV